ncbi:MAG: CPBP family glutamic-type intramembrane protease [Pseudomonadota bacterium]
MTTDGDKKPAVLSASDFGDRAPREARNDVPADVADGGITASDFDAGSSSFVFWGVLPFAAFLAVEITQFLVFRALPYAIGEYYWALGAFIAAIYLSLGVMAFRAARVYEKGNAGRRVDLLLATVMVVLAVILTVAVRDPGALLYADAYVHFGFGGLSITRILAVVLPSMGVVFLTESAIRGVVIGRLEQLRRKPVAIVATAAVFDFLAALMVTGVVFAGYGGIDFVIRVVIATVLAGVCFSVLRLCLGRVLPCIVVGVVGVLLTQIVRLG